MKAMGKYNDILSRLNDAQRLAVTTTEGPVLVIAGPGTGKTQLLTTRIAHILASTDTLPENILCLTFTESAAHTMRERLSGIIGQAAYSVTISTYHAFGSDLIRRFPDFFAADADLEPADDLSIDGIFREIIAKLPYSNPLKYSDTYIGDVKTLVSDAKRALLTPDMLRRIANDNLETIRTANPITQKILGAIVRLTKKDIASFATLHDELASLHTSSTLLGQLLEELGPATSEAEETGKTTPLTKWKNAWLAKDDTGLFILDGQKANEKILAAADVYEQYLTQLKTKRLFDYDDMILRAVHALETHSDFRFSLQERYQYVLLDEFQDTNGAQLKIVELLTNNPVNEGRPNVLAVGDDDQAIYAFQGANYSHMLKFKEMYRDVLAITLTKNYRSHAQILHTAGEIAEQIDERLHHHFPEIEKVLSAENTSLPKEAIVERREAESDVMQFAWVAKRIKKLIEDGMPQHEIAVLAPKHRFIEPLVPFLQQEGIPVRYDKREDILEDPAINQLLRMAELCLALRQDNTVTANALWAEVLSFELWNLPTSLIWRLSWQTHDEDQNWTETLLNTDKLKPIALFFMRLSHLADQETLETMLDYLIGSSALELHEPGYDLYTSPYYQHYFASITKPETKAQFWDLLNNLIVLRSRLREYKRSSDTFLVLKDFVDFVEAHRLSELKILNSSPYASALEAVQLMTVYKSKGMEFSAVFVLAVTDEAWGSKARSIGSRISLPPNLQYIRYAGATDAERLRLFYVAITRAKTQLYLMSYVTNYAGKATSHLKYLNETTDELYALQSPLLPDGKQHVLSAEEHAETPTTELSAYWQRRHEEALDSLDLQTLLHERLADYQLSPTHLNDFVDVIHCGPQSFFIRTILRFPQTPRPEMQYGNAMHETLEWMHHITRGDALLPSEPALLKYFAQRLDTKRLNEQNTALFLERGSQALRAYLKQRGVTVGPDNIVEHNFRNEGVFLGKAHLAGKIDKLIVDKKARTITIVDYKTGKSFNRWTREAKLHKYRMQLYLYRALVEGSHTFRGYQVTDAYLEFIEPDEHGTINELRLPFDEAEYRRVKKLAETTWTRIKQLQLPDITGYPADLSGIEAFESDLLH